MILRIFTSLSDTRRTSPFWISFPGMLTTSQWRTSRLNGWARDGASGSILKKFAKWICLQTVKSSQPTCHTNSVIRPFFSWPFYFCRFIFNLRWSKFFSQINWNSTVVRNLKENYTWLINEFSKESENQAYVDGCVRWDINYIRCNFMNMKSWHDIRGAYKTNYYSR